MIRCGGSIRGTNRGIPRESGDDPDDEALPPVEVAYSPRERG